MGLRRTTQPAIEPVTLDQAKSHLRVDVDDDDALIQDLIVTSRITCEKLLRRSLISSEWTLTLDSFCELTFIPRPPLISITSIGYVDSNATPQIMPPTDYRVDATGDLGRVEPTQSWPITADQMNAVTVVYTAGYGLTAQDVPAPFRAWMLLAIGDMYSNRERSSGRPVVPQRFADDLLDSDKVWVY